MTKLYQKIDTSPLLPYAKLFAGWIIKFTPTWIKPNQVTVFSFLMTVAAAVFYYCASFNKLWLLLTPLPIILNWLADNLDGELARARNQTSDRGFFLDLFLDNLGLTILALAIGFSSYSIFALWAVAHMISLLRTILILFGIILKKEFVLPTMGPAEGRFILITVTLFGFIWYGSIFQIGDYLLSCFDIFILILIPISGWEMVKSAWGLYHQID